MIELPEAMFRGIERGTASYRYRGIGCVKNPIDLAIMARLLWDVKPRTIIEVGSGDGGSALWLYDQMRSFGVTCEIFSVDTVPPQFKYVNRISFIQGNGHALGATFSDQHINVMPRPLMVIDDADHQPETTAAILEFFDRWSRPGEYVVVEDGWAERYYPGTYRGGPLAAIKMFMARRGADYEIDRGYCDMFGWTGNPDGYIKRVR